MLHEGDQCAITENGDRLFGVCAVCPGLALREMLQSRQQACWSVVSTSTFVEVPEVNQKIRGSGSKVFTFIILM